MTTQVRRGSSLPSIDKRMPNNAEMFLSYRFRTVKRIGKLSRTVDEPGTSPTLWHALFTRTLHLVKLHHNASAEKEGDVTNTTIILYNKQYTMALRTALKPLRKSLLPRTRAFSTELPRITERRPNETGRGGRASDAGVKVALFGATGFLGRYVSSGLGE